MKFGKTSKGSPGVFANRGKGGGAQYLPNRAAVNKLIHGDPAQRSMGNYAKLTPSGASAPQTYPAIIALGLDERDK